MAFLWYISLVCLVSLAVDGNPLLRNEQGIAQAGFSENSVKDLNIGQLFAFANLESRCQKKNQFAVAKKKDAENCYWNVTEDLSVTEVTEIPVLGMDSACIFACGEREVSSVQSSVMSVIKYFGSQTEKEKKFRKSDFDLYAYYHPCDAGNAGFEGIKDFNSVHYSRESQTKCEKFGSVESSDKYLSLKENEGKNETKIDDRNNKKMKWERGSMESERVEDRNNTDDRTASYENRNGTDSNSGRTSDEKDGKEKNQSNGEESGKSNGLENKETSRIENNKEQKNDNENQSGLTNEGQQDNGKGQKDGKKFGLEAIKQTTKVDMGVVNEIVSKMKGQKYATSDCPDLKDIKGKGGKDADEFLREAVESYAKQHLCKKKENNYELHG